MNENTPDLQTWIEPELEARIVAWVLGEASAFEMAELTRIVAEKPELEIFTRRIAAVHGLVAAAARPPSQPLQLAPDRRRKLLEKLGRTEPITAPNVEAIPTRQRRSAWRVSRRTMLAAAACLLVSLIAGALLFPAFNARRDSSRHHYLMAPALPSKPASAPVDSTKSRDERIALGGRVGSRADFRGSGTRGDAGSRSEISKLVGDESGAKQEDWKAGHDGLPREKDAGADVSRQLAATEERPAGLSQMQGRDSAGEKQPADRPAMASEPTSDEIDAKFAQTNAPSASASNRRDFFSDDAKPAGAPQPPNGSPSSSTSGPANLAAAAPATPAADFPKNHFALGEAKKGAGFLPESEQAARAVSGPVAANKAGPAATPQSTQAEIKTAEQPFSTFSLHVSDVSFRLAEAALARGEMPEAATIRPEEWYNAFDYGDPSPGGGEKVGCRIEQAAHPFLQQRNLVRIAMKVPAAGRGASQPLRLTVLLDTSGSMEREDRAAAVRRAFEVLATLLGPDDRVTLIGFSRLPRLLADSVPGNEARKLAELIASTPSEGGTNLEEALKLGSELARKHRLSAAQNRVVLLTDGAANLGNADAAQLGGMIETLRQQGIAFDACGVGADGLNDEILEALTRKGDGRYYLLDRPEDADSGFARQLAGAFRPAARNVKVQVRFNPARVGSYRLIGFEKHRLNKEDFRNDKVDAAELAAEEAAVALYQMEVLPEGEGEIGEVFVRFQDPADGRAVEQSWTITHDGQARAFDQAAASIQLAGTAALLAEKLRGGAAANLIELGTLAPVMTRLRGHFSEQRRVQQLAVMFEQMRRMEGKP